MAPALSAGRDDLIEGYACLFGEVDLGRDVIEPGAFAESLARRGPAGVRLLYQHDPAEPIGIWQDLREDARGLYVRGRLAGDVQRAREIASLIHVGALDGLSIGFKAVRARTDPRSRVRRLARIDLWEVSVVTFPMQPGARIAVPSFASRSPRPKEVRMTALSAPETKVVRPADLSPAEEMAMTFDAYRQTNDARLDEIERRGAADPLTVDALARIEAAIESQKDRLDAMTVKSLRPALSPLARRPATEARGSGGFHAYARTGAPDTKAMSAGSGADGGILAPAELEQEIGRRVASLSPVRAYATVRTMGAGVYRKPFLKTGPVAGWAAETAARSQSDSPVLAELNFPAMELYAMPAATQTLLDDAEVDLETWLAGEVDAAFAEQESAAFITGDGVAKPKGVLSYPAVAESAWAWDKIGYVASGAAGAFPAAHASDPLLDLIYALKGGYRQNAVFMMSRRTQAAVRKLKDAQGNYLWAPPAAVGQSASLMGFPVVESEHMPDIADGAFSIVFGDFARFYLVVDRAGLRVLRDPYSAKPYVLFYVTKRVGGGVQDFAAAKLLKFAAT